MLLFQIIQCNCVVLLYMSSSKMYMYMYAVHVVPCIVALFGFCVSYFGSFITFYELCVLLFSIL